MDRAAGDVTELVGLLANVQMLGQQVVEACQEALEVLGVVDDQVAVARQLEEVARVSDHGPGGRVPWVGGRQGDVSGNYSSAGIADDSGGYPCTSRGTGS